MILKIKISYDGIDDFILYCIFSEILIYSIVYKSGVLGSYYFAYINVDYTQYAEINKNYQIVKTIKNN